MKKDHLKKINVPKSIDDDEMNSILKEVSQTKRVAI